MKTTFDETKLVAVLEAFYELGKSDDEWLFDCLESLSRVTGPEHDYTAFFYDASDVENPKVGNPCRVRPLPPELTGVWGVFLRSLSPEFARATFRSLFVGSGRENPAFDFMKPILAEREKNGHGDIFYLNTLDPSGIGCSLLFSSRQPLFDLAGEQKMLLERVANHLAAACRVRRRLANGGALGVSNALTDVAEAVIDGQGRVVHAEGAAKEQTERAGLAAAAAVIDAARTTARRREGVLAMSEWHPLTSARWTLVDAFERDGRRYIVALDNQAEGPDFDVLTDREQQVVLHGALGLSTKEIAYMLGVSDSTVRVLLARAVKRLGMRSRHELFRHPALMSLAAVTSAQNDLPS